MKGKPIIFVVILIVVGLAVAYIGSQLLPKEIQEAELPFYDNLTHIKDGLTFVITQPGFTNPQPVCDVYEWREEGSEDYLQTTVNYYVFQHGQGLDGDVEAYLEIYNAPNRSDLFVVEIARTSWDELTVFYHGEEIVRFPSVVDNGLTSGQFTWTIKRGDI